MGREITFVVPGVAPTRPEPGVEARKDSPNADRLLQPLEVIRSREPTLFPISEPFGIRVTFGEQFTDPSPLGFGPIDPILEILVDAGFIVDKRQQQWEEYEPQSDRDHYAVTITLLGRPNGED